MGWGTAAWSEPVELRGPWGAGGATWSTAPLPDGQMLLLLNLDRPLPPFAESFKQYEDVSPLHRQVLAALAAEKIAVRHVLLLDPAFGAQFLDATQEDVLLDVRGEAEATERLLPLLQPSALARGSLSNFPRKAPRQRARELADWTRVWATRLGAASGASRDSITVTMHWLHLTRLAEVIGMGPAPKQDFAAFGLAPKAPPRTLLGRFKALHDHMNLLQGSTVAAQKRVVELAHGNGQLLPCLESFSRLSRSKFSAAIFAEAFADEELRAIGWRQALVNPPAESGEDAERWLLEPHVLPLDEEGLPALLAAFDRITEDLRRTAREHLLGRQRGERTGMQLDLLGAPPPDFTEEDAPRLTLERCLQVRTRHRARGELAAFILLAHAAEWAGRLRIPDPLFPRPQVVVEGAPRQAVDSRRQARQADLN